MNQEMNGVIVLFNVCVYECKLIYLSRFYKCEYIVNILYSNKLTIFTKNHTTFIHTEDSI